MMKLLFCLAACLVLAAGAWAEEPLWNDPPADFDVRHDDVTYGKMLYHTYLSKTTGNIRKMFIILPPDYSEERTYPVLYLLHGIGGDHSEWLGGRPDVVVGNLIAAGEAQEMIIVMPNVRARKHDSPNSSDMYTPAHFAAFDNFINDLTNDLMPYMKAHFSIAEGPENTAVAGLSMGGREALYIGLSRQDLFGYAGAFCPAPGVLPYHAEKGLFARADFRAAEGFEPYILINAGASDGVVGQWPATYAATLTENGTANTFYTMPGGHDFTVWKHGLYNFAQRIFK
ncbi:MAG: esterase family protein [Clostridiales bacterium]|nr:esterase family protein [Clostridiales bacterium]